MKPVFLSLALVAVMALPATRVLAGACGGGPIDSPDMLASHIVMDIGAGDLNFVESYFDPSMTAALPAPALADTWRAYQNQFGAFQSAGQPSVESHGALTVVDVPVRLAQGAGSVRIIFNPDMMIDGLSFLPAGSQGS